MRNYLCRPKRKDRQTKILVILLGILALFLFLLSTRFNAAKGVLQLCSALLFLVVVQFTTRFLLTDYRYGLEDGTLFLSSRQGRREKHLGGLPITSETAILSREEWKARKKEFPLSARFSYCQNLAPEQPYYLLAPEEEKGFVLLTFEPDETLLSLLNEEIKSRKGARYD
ncbi:MAG: hypothetical protein E7580_08245 [Ruminococcaceae bacterium]|nr:hypothetical protein [Oscillospiraceae bacterium]